jgi:hypothetical protein
MPLVSRAMRLLVVFCGLYIGIGIGAMMGLGRVPSMVWRLPLTMCAVALSVRGVNVGLALLVVGGIVLAMRRARWWLCLMPGVVGVLVGVVVTKSFG